jgi:hypothetical protein
MTKQRLIEESSIKKLIEDYENQIVEYDRKLSITREAENSARKSRKDLNINWVLEGLKNERHILNAQRQRTVQFISDLKYL